MTITPLPWSRDYIPTVEEWNYYLGQINQSAYADTLFAGVQGLIDAANAATLVASKTYADTKMSGSHAYVGDFLAVAADETAALQMALNTGKPVRLLERPMTLVRTVEASTAGQVVQGAGPGTSILRLAGPSGAFVVGVFIVDGGAAKDMRVEMRDFSISAKQPDTALRSALNGYPPLVFLNKAARCEMHNVRLVGGMHGLWMEGNCGGFSASFCSFGNFSHNVHIDGNLDVTSFIGCEIWPFSETGIMTAGQQSIFEDASTFGVYSLRNDYLGWIGGLILCGRAWYFGTGTRSDWPGFSYGSIVGVGSDTFGGLEVAAGDITATGCTFSVQGGGVNPNNAVKHTGGVVSLVNCKVFLGSGVAANSAVIYSQTAPGDCQLVVQNTNIELGYSDQRAVFVDTGGSANNSTVISGCKFDRIGAGTYTTPIVEINSGSGVITGNTLPVNVNASGNTNWLTLGAGIGPFVVTANNSYGWSKSFQGFSLAPATILTLPPIFGDEVPEVVITGSGTIGGLTYAIVGLNAPAGGREVMLRFASAATVTSGTLGVPGAIILSGRVSFAAATGSTLLLREASNGNFFEVGRCA